MMNYQRKYNFAAGPAILPVPVLESAASELLNYQNSGQSVMEMSHRSSEFKKIIEDAETNLRELMNIPDNYRVLFIQGGGTLQFSMIPMNLLNGSGKADYIITGSWANKAYREAKKFGDIRVAATSQDRNFTYIPEVKRKDIRADADYVYICYNNTIYGSCYDKLPDTGDIPLVADISSCILSREIDVSKFGLLFAGVQKNIGPAGVTIVIIREDLAGKAPEDIPVYLDYRSHISKESRYNTPPCFNIYMAGKMFRYIKEIGGTEELVKKAKVKEKKLYQYIDSSQLYGCPVREKDRSVNNVVFVTEDNKLDKLFVQQAKKEDIININGHRSVGGMRASLYNSMPEEGVDYLISFMKRFEEEYK